MLTTCFRPHAVPRAASSHDTLRAARGSLAASPAPLSSSARGAWKSVVAVVAALVCDVAMPRGPLLVRATVWLRSCFVVHFGLRVFIRRIFGVISILERSRLSTLDSPAAVAAACGFVTPGQRAPVDADTYVLIDRSTRLGWGGGGGGGRPLFDLLVPVRSCIEHVRRRDYGPSARPCHKVLSELLAPELLCRRRL